MYHQTPHTIDCHKAMAFIQSHGHHAAITADGLQATSWEAHTGNTVAQADDDEWHEAPQVFAIDEYGRVATKPIRDWLGY